MKKHSILVGQPNRIRKMASGWLDLNKDGRRLESMIREMRSKSKIQFKEGNTDMYFSYIDRVIKATNTKLSLAETVLNVKGFLALARKQYGALPTRGVITSDH